MVLAGMVVMDVVSGGAIWVSGEEVVEGDAQGAQRMGNGIHA